jgi:glycolate oxidase
MKDHIKKKLIEIVGADSYSDQLIDRVAYSYDGSSFSSRPDCAVWVTNAEQISQILHFADRERIPVVPRGAGTGISGNAVPVNGGIVLDLRRMNRILSIRISDRLAVVEPGVVYDDFQAALEPYGFFFPPDPASGKVCTLGGNVATNAGGVRGAKYGTTRDYVLALKVVLADGSMMRVGAETMKSSSGYDLARLFVGSEGTLGIFTEIMLKTAPRPAERATAMATFDRLENAGEAVTRIMHSDVTPSALELLDTTVVEMIRKHSSVALPSAEALILVETDGSDQQDVHNQMGRLVSVFDRCGAGKVETARTESDALRLWSIRKSIGGLIGAIDLDFMPEDLTVPMSRVTEYLRRCQEISKKQGLTILNFGHAGDGNFHTNILYNSTDAGHLARLAAARYDLHALACELGGTLTGEHGIGISKADFMPLEHDPVALRVMRTVKNALDPNNILNPGKMGLSGGG